MAHHNPIMPPKIARLRRISLQNSRGPPGPDCMATSFEQSTSTAIPSSTLRFSAARPSEHVSHGVVCHYGTDGGGWLLPHTHSREYFLKHSRGVASPVQGLVLMSVLLIVYSYFLKELTSCHLRPLHTRAPPLQSCITKCDGYLRAPCT